jgi:hypothetical protein
MLFYNAVRDVDEPYGDLPTSEFLQTRKKLGPTDKS